MRTSLSEVFHALRTADSAIVTAHVAPDGDAVGSMLATAALLRFLGTKPVACVMEDPVPEKYRWLPQARDIVTPDSVTHPADTIVVLDASRRERLGKVAGLVNSATRLVVIDHHPEPEPEGHVAFVDTRYAATGEIVAELFDLSGAPMDRDTAECLYTAIAADTGGFRFPSTSARTHRLVAKLVETGIDVADISTRVFDMVSPARFRLMVRVLSRMELCEEGRVACSLVTPRDLEETSAGSDALSNLMNFGRNIEGVQVAVLFRVVDAETTKISLRSTPGFDSSQVARHFGGGGHPGAAGATLTMPLEQTRVAVLNRIRACLGDML